jgi:hypothetical protein
MISLQNHERTTSVCDPVDGKITAPSEGQVFLEVSLSCLIKRVLRCDILSARSKRIQHTLQKGDKK